MVFAAGTAGGPAVGAAAGSSELDSARLFIFSVRGSRFGGHSAGGGVLPLLWASFLHSDGTVFSVGFLWRGDVSECAGGSFRSLITLTGLSTAPFGEPVIRELVVIAEDAEDSGGDDER